MKKCRFCQQVRSLILIAFVLVAIYFSTQLLPDWLNKSTQSENLFVVEQASSSLNNYEYYVDATLKMDFTPAVVEAMVSGVPLVIVIELTVSEQNKWLDKLVKKSLLQFELRYHALTDIYSIKNIESKQEYHFTSREEALDLLGNISHAHLISRQMLDKDKHHQVSLRVFLDIWQLPDVLRPLASLSNDWQLRSSWFRWMLN
ncbi:MAG: DUF4390 domain-containing protein [Pseudomonadota bacterium]